MDFTTVEWDGDTTGKTVIDIENGATWLCKVSDLSPTIDELIGGKLYLSEGQIGEITSERLMDIGIGCISEMFASINQTGTYEGITFPETGIYFIGAESGYVSKLEYGNNVVQIDPKFIPYVVFNTDSNFSTVSCNIDYTSLIEMLSNNKLKNAFLISPEFCASMVEIFYNSDNRYWRIRFYIERLCTEVDIEVSKIQTLGMTIEAGDSALTSAKNYIFSMLPLSKDELILKSSTPDSQKRFSITVDDSGTISATEVQPE